MVASPNQVKLNNEEELVREILRAVRGIRFGSVQIIIQDGRVIQIDKTEKLRLPREDLATT